MSHPYSGAPAGGPHRPPISGAMPPKDAYAAAGPPAGGRAPAGGRRRPPLDTRGGAGPAPRAPVGAPAGGRGPAPRTGGRPPISAYQPSQPAFPPSYPSYGYGTAPMMPQTQPFYPSMYSPAGGAPIMGGVPPGGAPIMGHPIVGGGAPVMGGPPTRPVAPERPASRPPVAASGGHPIVRSAETSAPSRPPAGRRPPVVPTDPPAPARYGAGAPIVGAPVVGAPIVGAPTTTASRPPMASKPLFTEIDPRATVCVMPRQEDTKIMPKAPIVPSAETGDLDDGAPTAPSEPKIWQPFTGDKKAPVFSSLAPQIRYVLSGDTVKIALRSTTKYEPAKIILFSLEGIYTPRLPRFGAKIESSNAYSFEARDFVRSLVGKEPVFFAVWRAVKEERAGSSSAPWRYFGDVYIRDKSSSNGYRSLTEAIVAAGFADVKGKDSSSSLSDFEYDRLKKAEAAARSSKLGKFTDREYAQRTTKDIQQKSGGNRAFFKRYEKKTLDGVVEKALSGSFFRVVVEPASAGEPYESVLVHLAGATCARPDPKLDQPNSYAFESLDWAEARVLGERVQLSPVAIDPKDNVYVRMDHPRGKVAESLLRNGLAQYEAWTANAAGTTEAEVLLSAVKQASDARLNIFAHKEFKESSTELQGVVTQVQSADTISVLTESGELRRFILASVRGPRRLPRDFDPRREAKRSAARSPKKGGAERDEAKEADRIAGDRKREASYSLPAKHFVRSKLIGKTVTVKFEYEREAGDDILQHASVLFGRSQNISIMLAKEGYATVVKHRQDEPKSQFYKALCDAENVARSAGKGLWSKKLAPEPIDLSSDILSKMSERELITFHNTLKDKTFDGVIEYVFRGDRVKVYLTKPNVILVMSLNGVRTTNDQWGKEATEYLRERIFQRDVKVRIEVSHSTGSTPSRRRRGGGKDKHSSEPEASTPQYFGEIIVNEKDGDINIAHELINKGLIRVVVRRRRKEAGGRRVEWIDETDPILRAIEDKARESLVGLWQEEAEREEKRDEERRAKFQTGETKNVRISYIATANSFWVIDTDSISDMSRVQSVLATAKRDALRRVKSGSIVAALFDGEWARARVERRNQDQDNAWLVLFLDYGNRATIEEKNMSVLPDELRVTELEPLAHRCILAGTRVAPTSSHMHVWRAAGNKFAELTMERDLQVNVLFDDYDNRKWYVDLIIPAGKGAASAAAAVTPAEDSTAPAPATPSASASSITKVLVSEGLLRTDPKRLDNPEDLYTSEASDDAAAFLRDIQVMERSAREEKRGMWHGGDVADD